MASLTLTRDVAAPPDRVWHVLTDLDAAEQILSGVTRLEVLTEGPYRVGTTWRETRRILGRETTTQMRVTGVEALGSTRIEASAGSVDYTTTFDLQALHPGTRLTMRFEGVPTGTGRLQLLTWSVLGPLGVLATRRSMKRDLDDIAAAAAQAQGAG